MLESHGKRRDERDSDRVAVIVSRIESWNCKFQMI